MTRKFEKIFLHAYVREALLLLWVTGAMLEESHMARAKRAVTRSRLKLYPEPAIPLKAGGR